jgi:DNA polymerase-3 subunit delta'
LAKKKVQEEHDVPVIMERPVTIDGFFGHARQVALLGRLLERGMVSSSLLFSGPASVGKASLAFRLAAALQCEAPLPWACGRCPSCLKAQKGVHPDIRFITLEVNEDTGKERKEILVRQAREDIIGHLSLPPYEGRKLIFIVDPAEAMNAETQNALLKSLEEPPAYAQFILVSANAANLLPTVRSRCQEVTFGLVPQKTLQTIALAAGLEGAEAKEAISSSAGAPGVIFSGSWREAAKRRERLLALLQFGLQAEQYPKLAPMMEELAKEPPRAVLAEALRITAEARRALSLKGGGPNQQMSKAAKARGEHSLSRIAERLAEAPAHIERNVNPRLLLERVFLAP